MESRTHPELTSPTDPTTDAFRHLADRIRSRTGTVAVVGLGYAGLPLLVAACDRGFPAVGLDTDEERVSTLRGGHSYVVDVSDAVVRDLLGAHLSSDPLELRDAMAFLIVVPTPLGDGIPDLSFVKDAAAQVAKALRPGCLVILESTTYPGTTEEVVRPILETSGLEAGRDFALAYSPERIDPGSALGPRDIPKIVGGLGPSDAEVAEILYTELGFQVTRAPSLRVAEMAKLLENTFRQVNIALVNELATVARELDVDIWAAIDMAATKLFGYMPFWPGPGVGGHCIAIDPTYLSWRAGQRLGFGIGFVEHAKEVNQRMPGYVAARIGEALNDAGKAVRGAKVMAIGLTYKEDVNDVRESPAIDVMERLAKFGAECSYHDPYVENVELLGEEYSSQPLEPDRISSQDCVVILTAHSAIDYEGLVRSARLVFDARGVTRGLSASNVVRL